MDEKKHITGYKISAFIMGLFLGPLGILASCVFGHFNYRNMDIGFKFSFLGWATAIVFIIVVWVCIRAFIMPLEETKDISTFMDTESGREYLYREYYACLIERDNVREFIEDATMEMFEEEYGLSETSKYGKEYLDTWLDDEEAFITSQKIIYKLDNSYLVAITGLLKEYCRWEGD